ncbi:MAG: glycoside hydrolase family 65 protein, partial [Bacilli bacterium]|nr:glycoside hydrolase family 65 protein [Bacilli bacterium]
MKDTYLRKGFDRSSIIQDGNRFLLGNGHIGYRGTLEEYGKEQLVGLTIAGVYDQYKDEWRENLSLPNPFFFRAYCEGEEISSLTKKPLSHKVELDIEKAMYSRFSEFEELTISSSRFVSHDDDCLLGSKIMVTANKDGRFFFRFGLNKDIYEIHGPHFASMEVESRGMESRFH